MEDDPFHSGRSPGPDLDDFEWFDSWCEEHQRLRDAEDTAGLVALCQLRVDRFPQDLHGLEALAEAYLGAGEPEQAIALVRDKYDEEPDHPLFERVIAEALRAQGKPWDAFCWRQPPDLVFLNEDLLTWLQGRLKRKRKTVHLSDLWMAVESLGHPFFSEAELYGALQRDAKFQVNGSDLSGRETVTLR